MAPRDKTACQTFPCKCKICISSIESDVYNKKKIQMFVVNMTFISSREVKKCIFHSCLRHSWNIHFFTSLDEIKVIFTPNIWISSIYFIVSGEISVYLMKIKVVSITSELISYHFTIVNDTIYFSLFALDDFGFLHCFRSGCYLHFRFLNTSNFFVSELNYQVLVCIFLVRM